MITLYEHQKEGRDFLLEHKKACLFFEVGTGKTYTALSALTSLPSGKALIIAPKKVLYDMWLKEKAYDLSNYNVTFINYEKIARMKTVKELKADYIILDEVHRIKGRTSKTSKKIRELCKTAKYVWGLTGTPVANNYADVYNIFTNMTIKEFENMNYSEFCDRYYNYYTLNTKFDYGIRILTTPKTNKLPELISRIGHESMTKRLANCTSLPDKQVFEIKVAYKANNIYKELREGVFDLGNECRTMIPLETIAKLHQASNGFVYTSDKTAIPIPKSSHKIEELQELIEDLVEETPHVIIVYKFVYDKEIIKNALKDYKVTDDHEEFPNNQILLLQANQSEGLNLQYCNVMIFYSYDYNFLNYEQMCGRIYRTGQTKKVLYYVLISQGTIEEKIWDALKNKKSRDEFLKEVLDGQ